MACPLRGFTADECALLPVCVARLDGGDGVRSANALPRDREPLLVELSEFGRNLVVEAATKRRQRRILRVDLFKARAQPGITQERGPDDGIGSMGAQV